MPTGNLKWEPEEINETQDTAALSDGERLLCYIRHVKPSPHADIQWWNIHDATLPSAPVIASAPRQQEARGLAEEYVRDRRRMAQTA